ncbi:MAG: tetratricopeptide repeat protein [Ferruginibacter sp.]
MKVLCRLIVLFLLTGIVFPIYVAGQDGTSTQELREKLKRLEKQPGYLQDTAYANTLTDLAYIYSYSYPDSALAILDGHAERCHSAGDTKGEADTYLILGDAFQTKGIFDKALEYYEKSLRLEKNIKNHQKQESLLLNRIGIIHLNQGNYPEALSKFYESLKAAETIDNKELIGATLNNIANVHFHQGKFDEAEKDYQERLKIAAETADSSSMSLAYNSIGEVNLKQKELAKALRNLGIGYQLASRVNDQEMLLITTLSMAEAYYVTDSLENAVSLFEDGLRLSKQRDNGTFICNALIGLAKVYNRQGKSDAALANGLEALQKAGQMGQVQLMRDAGEIVSNIYEARGDGLNALKYYRVYKLNSDSLNNLASQRAVAIEKASYEFSKKEIEFQRKTLQQRWLTFAAFAALFTLCVILFVIYQSRKRLNLTYKDLQHKNTVIETQRIKAEETLTQLQAAQSQLIQSEKMASLGELTAGIAHEIQNPLNFVNNFSEINRELLAEMNDGIDNKNYEEVKELAKDISNNEEKINHHGKRADAIVKGMLQHSRSSSGQKVPTDINALADEYLRLAYHGLRAKDKSFNATMKTDYDESIENIDIIPQDIGRVLLNLINNAFYAMDEKKKQQPAGYEPTVSITTKKTGNRITISVSDNGNGIPQKILDKIFQPFFTTKPTGQGTGLGLSLSYDIVKAHGGELKVKTKEDEGAEFVIQLTNQNM